MKYTVKCPCCGTVNTGLDLLETNGSMECITCGRKVVGLLLSVPKKLPYLPGRPMKIRRARH